MIDQRHKKVTFLSAVKDFFRGYVDFKGYTTRAGYWWVMLGLAMLWILLLFVSFNTFFNVIFPAYNQFYPAHIGSLFSLLLLIIIVCLALALPTLALITRRLRDAGVSVGTTIVLLVVQVLGGVDFGHSLLSVLSNISTVIILVFSLMPSDYLRTDSKHGFMTFAFLPKTSEQSSADASEVVKNTEEMIKDMGNQPVSTDESVSSDDVIETEEMIAEVKTEVSETLAEHKDITTESAEEKSQSVETVVDNEMSDDNQV